MIRAVLKPIDPLGRGFLFAFNPSEYEHGKEAQWAEVGIPGLEFPVQQYVRGGARTMSVEAYLNQDGYDAVRDVPEDVALLQGLARQTTETKVPPICLFTWGRGEDFVCVVTSVSVTYTMFNSIGQAIEATVRLSLREYIEKDVTFELPTRESLLYEKKRPVFSGSRASGSMFDRPEAGGPARALAVAEKSKVKEITTERNTSLQRLSAAHYGDPSLWRAVEFTNRGRRSWDNLRQIRSGDRYFVPDVENALGLVEDTTNFPPEIREGLKLGRMKTHESHSLIRAVTA